MEQPPSTSAGGDLLTLLNSAALASSRREDAVEYRMGRSAAEFLFNIRGERTPKDPEQSLKPNGTNTTHRIILLGVAWNVVHAIAGITTEEREVMDRVRHKVIANFNTEVGRTVNPTAPARQTETQRIYDRLINS